MIAVLRAVLGALVAFAAVLFALANRGTATVIWSPFHAPADLPVFLPVLSALAVGFLCGGVFVWLSGAAVRVERRRQVKTIRALEKQVSVTAADSV